MRRLALLIALLPVTAAAQGTLYQSIAQTVASVPGSAQGVTQVLVPIPNAIVKVCTGTYAGVACNTQTALVYSDEAMTHQLTPYVTADGYGNFYFWAASGTYYYTVTGAVSGSTVTGTYQAQLPANISGSTLTASVINATTGFENNGLAPLDHVLLGNGSQYVDSASIPASIITGLPGSYYQTVQAQGTSEPQEAKLNFADAGFLLSDSSLNGQTSVNLNRTGTGSYVVTSTASNNTSTQLAKYDGAGNMTPSGLTLLGTHTHLQTVSSTWVDEWFTVSSPCTLATSTDSSCTGTITLPTAMPNATYFIMLTANATGGANIVLDVNGTPGNTSFPYIAGCTFNCTNTAYTIQVHAHHD